MIGPFLEESRGSGGTGSGRAGRRRRGFPPVAALLLCLVLLFQAAPAYLADGPATDARSFEQRAAAERTSRSRFRRLEVASLVLILVCGGAVVLWAIRRK